MGRATPSPMIGRPVPLSVCEQLPPRPVDPQPLTLCECEGGIALGRSSCNALGITTHRWHACATVAERLLEVSFPSLKPLSSYIADLVARLSFFRHWETHGHPPTYWISGFFFTQSFLTGVLQNFARKFELAIDTLGWQYHVLKKSFADQETFTKPETGCYVYGLFIEGSRRALQGLVLFGAGRIRSNVAAPFVKARVGVVTPLLPGTVKVRRQEAASYMSSSDNPVDFPVHCTFDRFPCSVTPTTIGRSWTCQKKSTSGPWCLAPFLVRSRDTL